MRKILREEFGYEGMVVSDWESITEMIAHGFCKDKKEAAFRAMKAGVDMEMTSTSYNEHLENLIAENKIDIKLIDEAVRRILYLKIRIGLIRKSIPHCRKCQKSGLRRALGSSQAGSN